MVTQKKMVEMAGFEPASKNHPSVHLRACSGHLNLTFSIATKQAFKKASHFGFHPARHGTAQAYLLRMTLQEPVTRLTRKQ